MAPDTAKTEVPHCAEHVLVNITASYCSVEDRIRLHGKTQKNALVEVWITQRLGCALIKHLLERTGVLPAAQGSAAGKGENNEDTGAASAQSETPKQTQGEDIADRAPNVSMLVREVDIACNAHVSRLVFRQPPAEAIVSATLNSKELASWMHALRKCFDYAGWQSECWRPVAKLDSAHEHSSTTIH